MSLGDAVGENAARDFFISYTAVNEPWARWIAVTLEQAGYTTLVQVFDFRPGGDFLHEMQQATSRTARTIALLSPAYLGSRFGEAEWRAAFDRDPTGEQGLLIPVRVQPVEPPGLLASRIFIDLVDTDETTARQRLLDGVGRPPPRPTTAPFPGGSQGTASVGEAQTPRFPGLDPGIEADPIETQPITASAGFGSSAASLPTSALLAWVREEPTVLHGPAGGRELYDGILSIAFSPDSLLLAIGGNETVRVWNPDACQLLRVLVGHRNWVRAVAFAPGGRILASGSLDSTVRLWDADSGAALRTLSGHKKAVRAVAFAPGGRILASGSLDTTVRLWDATSGAALRTLSGHKKAVRAVAFAPAEYLLATGGDDTLVRLWDPETGKLKHTLAGHTQPVTSVAFSPDGRQMVTGSEDLTVRLWDPEKGKLKNTLAGHTQSVTSVAFSRDGRLLATGSLDETVRLRVGRTGEFHALPHHGGSVTALAFSPNGRLFAIGSRDGNARVWPVH